VSKRVERQAVRQFCGGVTVVIGHEAVAYLMEHNGRNEGNDVVVGRHFRFLVSHERAGAH
jgi:hypothetical protein